MQVRAIVGARQGRAGQQLQAGQGSVRQGRTWIQQGRTGEQRKPGLWQTVQPSSAPVP